MSKEQSFTMTEAKDSRAGLLIEEWQWENSRAGDDLDRLAEVLHAAVAGGAGVNFFAPFSLAEARAFWVERVLPGMRAGTRRVLVARLNERIVGTAQLNLDLPPNQHHRAEVLKLLVHPEARRRGMARALMLALENIARAEGKTLLTLDTVSGSSAEDLYTSLGYHTAGVIPRYARAALTPKLVDATFMYKELE